MNTLTLKPETTGSSTFHTDTIVSRDVLDTLKRHKLLESVTPDSFPPLFKTQIQIDLLSADVTDGHYLLGFYTELEPSDEMLFAENDSINMEIEDKAENKAEDEDDDGEEEKKYVPDLVWFEVEIPKDSELIKEDTEHQIVIELGYARGSYEKIIQ